ncbi:MAG: preprotein translocase subunit SecG [Gammaproteobacteria bacterium]|nr:MAG: preprotein translocase subunit SecG [Gammaproteobacteria bacterium]
MLTIHSLLLIAHVLISVAIIGLVLLQRGKGAEAGAAFGAGASGTVFGARGSANFLSRSTAVLATLFFITSLSLAYVGAQRPESRSVIDAAPPAGEAGLSPAPDQSSGELPALPEETVPAVPAPPQEAPAGEPATAPAAD